VSKVNIRKELVWTEAPLSTFGMETAESQPEFAVNLSETGSWYRKKYRSTNPLVQNINFLFQMFPLSSGDHRPGNEHHNTTA
jgi:hypothetical protein